MPGLLNLTLLDGRMGRMGCMGRMGRMGRVTAVSRWTVPSANVALRTINKVGYMLLLGSST